DGIRDDLVTGVQTCALPICVTVQTDNATAGPHRAAVFGGVELLLRERRDQQPQAFELFGIQYPVEQVVKVVKSNQFTLGHVTEIGPRREINGWRELRQKVVRQVKIQIEAREVSPFLFLNLVDMELWE